MLDPDSRQLIDKLVQAGMRPYEEVGVAAARAMSRERRAITQPDPPAAQVRPATAPGPGGDIALRVYRPLGVDTAQVLPGLVYFHGGGWTIGDLDTHDTLCRELSNGSGASVVAVDYRLGPENRFPAAVEDAFAATRWVRHNARALGLDAKRLAVGGDSAGGNLATVVALLAREAGDLPLRFQLLIYPATDMRCIAPSHTTNGQGYLLTASVIRWFLDQYLRHPDQKTDWRASPLLHPDVSDLPPALILTAGFDPLRDEGAQYADALTQAGNRTTYVCFERQVHGFITMGRVIREANTAVALCASELRRALA